MPSMKPFKTASPSTALTVAMLVASTAKAQIETVCTETCRWTSDGECDDGGPGAAYSGCAYGSDCADCGVRCGGTQISNNASSDPPCVPCGNREEPNNAYDACIPCARHNATEFADAPGCVITQCDPQYTLHIRTGGLACDPIQEGPGCGHECEHADDGECDDGAAGAVSIECAYGSDCRDCGERETIECPNKHEFKHNSTSAWCEPCERDNALGFEDVGGNKCVVSECRTGYFLSLDGAHCDVYKEGKGCNNDCVYHRDGECDDGSDSSFGWLFADCATGTDCADCGLQCPNAHEEQSRACVVCERPGAAHFEDAEGCVIHNCSEGNNLTDAGECEAVPELCYIGRSGYEITDEGVCAECDVPHAVSYVPGVNGCEVESCGSGFKLTDAECIADTPEPTPQPPVTTVVNRDVTTGNANDDDDGFNPLWLLLLLLIPCLLLVGLGVFCMMKKKGGSAAGSEDDATKGLITLNEEQGEAPLLPEPEAEAVEADGEVEQAKAESEQDTMDL